MELHLVPTEGQHKKFMITSLVKITSSQTLLAQILLKLKREGSLLSDSYSVAEFGVPLVLQDLSQCANDGYSNDNIILAVYLHNL